MTSDVTRHPAEKGHTSVTLIALLYPEPEPQDEGVIWTEEFEIWDSADNMVGNDCEVRDHPEVPLTVERRDAVLARMGYTRTGAWVETDRDHAKASVQHASLPADSPSRPVAGPQDAWRNVMTGLGEDEPAVLDRILADLHEREGLNDAAIAALPPWELDALDDRYRWLGRQ
ncbi:hypothetical protein [Planomonospora parontospora]|uniref:hypothetical protein n=1 Tax=Planomonospora parontospora TaxID=58119 RepID=UPI001670F308|nr:hypothetical protein [Planomonospora parontospora]